MDLQTNGHRRLIIGKDIDDSSLDFLGAFLVFFEQQTGRKLRYDDFFSYSLAEVAGLTDEEAQPYYDAFKRSPAYRTLKPLSGVCEALRELHKIGDIHNLSAREPRELDHTKKYLEEQFGIPFAGYHLCKRAEVSWSDVPRVKAEIALAEKMDCVIEDSAWNSVVIAEHGVRVFVPPRPWNARVKHDNITRCDWPEIPRHLEAYRENGYKWK